MKTKSILLCISSVVILFTSCTTTDISPIYYPSKVIVYVGPMLLKVDNEWLFEENGQKILRFGFIKEPCYTTAFTESDNKLLTPEQLAISEGELTLCQFGSLREQREINTYDIPVTKNEFWIDLYFGILNTTFGNKERTKKTSGVISVKGIYVYHPTKKKWWGYDAYKIRPYISYVLDEDLYKLKAESENEVCEKISEYYDAMRTDKPFYDFEMLDKRVFTLPSMKVYEENLKDYLIKNNSFSWFGVKPENMFKLQTSNTK